MILRPNMFFCGEGIQTYKYIYVKNMLIISGFLYLYLGIYVQLVEHIYLIIYI